MLVFIDESGDSGLKIEKGSSRYFTVGLVVFEDNAEALACDQRMQLLKSESGLSENTEFHFKRNSDKFKRAFLTAIAPYDFFYYGIVINKDPDKLCGDGFRNKESFYKYACGLVFENAKEKLDKMNTGKLLPIWKFMYKFGQNKNSRTYPLRERGDKRHNLIRKQFHLYSIIM
ncbi:MAG: DUF3800 domain-containing protein [Patescibacteria group bacterium]